MTDEWKAWLAQLAADGRGGNAATLPAIVRGDNYAFVLTFAADYGGDAFTGSIRLGPDVTGDALADFTVEVGPYTGGTTSVTFSLTDAETDIGTDGDMDGLAWLVYSIQHVPEGLNGYRAIAGLVPVSGRV